MQTFPSVRLITTHMRRGDVGVAFTVYFNMNLVNAPISSFRCIGRLEQGTPPSFLFKAYEIVIREACCKFHRYNATPARVLSFQC